jgi:ATP-dependent Clp protease ATP-binding subunit ClpX
VVCDLLIEEENVFNRNAASTTYLKPSDIKGFLDQYVIGQERAKRVISIAAYNHFKRVSANREAVRKGYQLPFLKKSNILMIGLKFGQKAEPKNGRM